MIECVTQHAEVNHNVDPSSIIDQVPVSKQGCVITILTINEQSHTKESIEQIDKTDKRRKGFIQISPRLIMTLLRRNPPPPFHSSPSTRRRAKNWGVLQC
jgi:hypothetical protein